MSLLQYYLDRGISPVHYLADSLTGHLERRQSLYDMLGLPGLLFRDKRVLEVAAGSGQNSLYVATQHPARYVFVEPNPVALEQIKQTYADFTLPHTRPEIVPVMLEDFKPDEAFDVVICEGWLGSSAHERALVGVLADHVAPGGLLILTALSLSGWTANLIRYGLTQKLLAGVSGEDYDAQVALALEALSPHLGTIQGMTRRHEDWVKDNMVNPTYLDQGLTLEMVLEQTALRGFTVFGSSPAFITEWRWFKQLHGEARRTDENALACYERWSHNFLDYRRTFGEREVEKNRELNRLAVNLLDALSQSKGRSPNQLNQAYFDSIADILAPLAENLLDVAEDLGEATMEAATLLRAGAVTQNDLAAMRDFSPWFGRETLYFALQKATLRKN